MQWYRVVTTTQEFQPPGYETQCAQKREGIIGRGLSLMQAWHN